MEDIRFTVKATRTELEDRIVVEPPIADEIAQKVNEGRRFFQPKVEQSELCTVFSSPAGPDASRASLKAEIVASELVALGVDSVSVDDGVDCYEVLA